MADEQQKPTPVPYGSARPAERTDAGAGQAAATVATAPGPGESGGYSPRRAADVGQTPPGREAAAQFAHALRAGWARGIGLLASAVMIVAVILAVLFAVHILFAVFSANPDNSIVEFVNRWAMRFGWRFTSLFTPHSQRVAAVANYGISAVVYLIAGRIAAGLIRRLA